MKFYKGQRVVTLEGAYGYRPSTPEEKAAWYDKKFAYAPHDEAGERWVHDGVEGLPQTPGTVLEVVRGVARARVGWTTRSGYSEVRSLTTGEVFKVQRKFLKIQEA